MLLIEHILLLKLLIDKLLQVDIHNKDKIIEIKLIELVELPSLELGMRRQEIIMDMELDKTDMLIMNLKDNKHH
jgi:hypothetical protein